MKMMKAIKSGAVIRPLAALLRALLLCAALLAATAPLAAFAADDGVYLAATNTYYLNPDTGVTDDGGSKNAAIGEGMCRSVIYEKALVEIEDGKVYATVRVQLVSNMGAIKFTVQQKAGDPASYASVSPRIIAEDAGADTADYRFALPSVTGYIGCSTYVTPMGRDVKFYMNLSSSLTAGSGDFVVSVKPAAASVPEPAADREPAPEPAQEAQTISPAETDAGAPQTLSDTQTPAAEQAPAEAGPSTDTVANAADENADEAGANENAAPELADGARDAGETPAEDIGGADVGNAVDSGAATGAVSESERDENPSGGFNGIMVGVIALIVIAVVICAVMVLRKKQRSGKV
jgi:hypothetical protein